MMRGFVLLATLLLVVTSGAIAKQAGPEPAVQITAGSQADRLIDPPIQAFSRQDTIYWGGHDGAGYAIEGGVWDFEGTGGTGDLQGWTSTDVTADPEVYFYRTSVADFSTDPCNPMLNIPDSEWQIWCGIHEDDANAMDYVSGIGYSNYMCQSAYSPSLPAGDVTIEFSYFNDTELDYDYTFLYVRCLDSGGELVENGEVELDRISNQVGSPQTPATWTGGVASDQFPAGTAQVQFEIRFEADGAWSDEDGLYDCACGPFAADNISFTAGTNSHFADFEEDVNGYEFDKCAGAGVYMGLVDEATYTQWLEFVGLACSCTLSGWALEFVDEEGSLYGIPGHFAGQRELAVTPIIDRESYLPPAYNTALAEWDNYVFLRQSWGGHYRPGYMIYPFTTEVNPEPHWSQRMGQDTHYYTGDTPLCYLNNTNLTTLDGQGGDPMPNEWQLMRFCYEVYNSCEAFGIPSTVCVEEGNTKGSPVIDNVRVMLSGAADAPAIALDTGLWWHDGFGQGFPAYLEPSDLANSNVTRDLSPTNEATPTENDWHADSAVVIGPTVSSEAGRWLADLCFRIFPGPRQQLIPQYQSWKSRLNGDPEADFVCVLMDSLETNQGVFANKMISYFHEDDPGFDLSAGDFSEAQEILPDQVWTPGTSIQYYYRSYWYDGGGVPEEYFIYPPGQAEFEILPGMESVDVGDSYGQDAYEIVWPCVLYIDAYNRGVEYYINPMLSQMGLAYDKFDYLDGSSNWHTPLSRSFGGTKYNPGGYGNNGLTPEQMMGYRLILCNTGIFGGGAMEAKDWPLFESWLTATTCGLDDIRRGLIFDGDEVAGIMNDYAPAGRNFLNNTLGCTVEWESYRDYINDWEFCVFLNADANAVFEVEEHDLTLYGNGCPNTYNYHVLGLQAGVSGTVGNYLFNDTPYSQVVRDHSAEGRSFRSVVDGFSLHHLSYLQLSEDCPSDSGSVVEGASAMLAVMLEWMTDDTQPWESWQYPCANVDVDEDQESHLTGPANFLFASRPNPFHHSAAIRFSLARAGQVEIGIHDVTGRLVRTLINGMREAGDNTVTWDGADGDGNRVAGGVYWVTMSTEDFNSGKKMVVLIIS